jgi:lipopolysaccharide biosynthesis regulator YciM
VQLAQQHVANKSYGHAREALQNALMLRPKDARAGRLLKEVETEEQEYMRLRREKTELYQAAVNAWQNGEVSQALSQMRLVLDLDQRAPDASSPDAAGTYQSFYNKIRSEHDAMQGGYADARRLLAEKDFGKALDLCRGFLEKYPGQALFQALKFDIEEQQRQRLSAYIADVDRRLEAEPDLDARVHLIREAVSEFPEENHFRRVAKLIEDKRDLVNSIVERAKLHESNQQFTEAINDFETLRTIYSGYPGLNFEKERLQKRLEQQTRDAARAKWVRQIDAQLQTGDYDRANDLLDKAEVEFPADAELAELRKLAGQGIDRAKRADQLVAEGQQLCEEGQFEQGVDLLKIALQLEDRTPVRMVLRDLLVGRAQQIFDTDWKAAGDLVDQGLELDPNHALGKSLRSRVLDKRREEEVGQWASTARRLQAEGQIEEAMAEIDKGLAVYPSDTRLGVIADALKKELGRTQPSVPAVEQTRLTPSTRGSSATRPEPADVLERTRIIPERRSGEPAPIEGRPAAVGGEAGQEAWEKTQIAQRTPAGDVAPAPAAPAGTRTTIKAPVAPSRLMLIGAAAVVLLAIAVWQFWPTGGPPPPPPDSKVIVRGLPGTNVFAGDRHIGEIKPDGTIEFVLAAGAHTLRFDLMGYLPKPLEVRAVDGQPIDVTVGDLQPLPPQTAVIRFRGLKPGSRVLIDNQEAGAIADDGTLEAKTSPGTRTIEILTSGYKPYQVTVTATADQPFEISDVKLEPEVGKPAPAPAPGPAKPTTARLRLEQFPPDTRVLVDGALVHTFGSEGTHTVDNLPVRPSATIQFQRPGYEPASIQRPFVAGGTVVVTAADVPMTRAPVGISFVTVPGTTVQIRQGGKPVQNFTNSTRLSLAEGQYEVASKGPAGIELTDPLTVTADTKQVTVRVVGGIERFSGWSSTGGWYYRKATSDGFVPYLDTTSEGRFTFTVRRLERRGNPFSTGDRLRFAVAYVDPQNYIMCELDRDNFYRIERRNGVDVKDSVRRVAHGIPTNSTFVHFTVQASPNGVLAVSYSLDAKSYTQIDQWNLLGAQAKAFAQAIAKGRFAFSLRENDELWIQNFQYHPPAR